MNKLRLLVHYTYQFLFVNIRTFFNCLCSGLKYNKTWDIKGRPYVLKTPLFLRLMHPEIEKGSIQIGDGFKCNNKLTYNSVGIFQPCLFNLTVSGSRIIIGDNVGISGSTINSTTTITIGDNTIIGSGCIITDTDSHPIKPEHRLSPDGGKYIHSKPITIGKNVFIGARSIILKGVTIGDGAVVGAGSIVSKDVAPNTIVAGNPAVFVKNIE